MSGVATAGRRPSAAESRPWITQVSMKMNWERNRAWWDAKAPQEEQDLGDEVLFEQFLDLCERFDREILPDGPGTRQRAGLIAVAERAE